MNITIKGSVDAGKLNEELAAALGDWCVGWTPRHNAHEAIVDLSPEREGDEDLVRVTILSHLDRVPAREVEKRFAAKFLAVEAQVTSRMLIESALGDADSTARLSAIQQQLKDLRAERAAALSNL